MAQDAAPGCLQYGEVDRRVAQHFAGGARTCHVPGGDPGAADEHPLGGGHADGLAGRGHDVGDHASGGRFAVRASNRHDRHPGGAAGGEEHVDDGHPHIAWPPDCGVGVDRQTRLLVDLDDGPPLIVDRAGNVGGDEVDAGHIQPDHHRHLPGDLDVVGMDLVGTIDSGAAGPQFAGQLQLNELPRLRDILQTQPLLGQDGKGVRVDRDARQHLLVAYPATRIGVGDLDELGDGVPPVADDMRWHPLDDGYDLVGDDQDAVVLAGDEGLDDNLPPTALSVRERESLAHRGLIGQIDHYAPAIGRIEGLDNDGIADGLGYRGRLVGGVDHGVAWNRESRLPQQARGQMLVGGDLVGEQ